MFGFLKQNFLLLLFGLLFITVAFIYIKKIRRCTLFLLGAGFIYIGLVVLYKNGIGIEALYVWSTKYVKMICSVLSKITEVVLTEQFIVSKIILYILRHSMEEILAFMFVSCSILLFFIFLIGVLVPYLKLERKNYLPNQFGRVIKLEALPHTNKETKPLFLLNAVLRI